MFYTIIDFPLGRIFLAKNPKGLSIAHCMKSSDRLEKVIESFKKWDAPFERDKSKFRLEKELFSRYFQGKKEDFSSLPVDFVSGTAYQKRVWLEARKIPYGKTETYKSLAFRLNHKGYRSVGQALSKNPLLIVIPCHRVLGSDGQLVGFGAGLKVKEFLLRLEKGENPA